MGNKLDKLQSKQHEDEGSTTNEKHVKRPKPRTGEIDVDEFRIAVYPNIGQGSYGQVCKAVHLTTGATVAAKGIKFTFGTDEDEKLRKMALEEADKMLMVDHPNIAKLLGYSHHLGTAWLFIEFCDLGDLDKYMHAKFAHAINPKLSLGLKLRIMQGVTEAVAYLHNCTPAIIHGDIKPANILMITKGKENIPKLTDFGFAKLNQYSSSLSESISCSTGLFSAKGTPQYMAPELFLANDSGFRYEPSVDTFSLGLLFAVMLDFGPDNKSLFPVSVENRRSRQMEIFGRELMKKKQDGECLPQIVEFSIKDLNAASILKNLICGMTKYIPKTRATTEHARIELLKLCSWTASTPCFYTQNRAFSHELSSEETSGTTCLRVIGNELWSCESNGATVFDFNLNTIRQIRRNEFGSVLSAAQLDEESVVVATLGGLYIISNSGDVKEHINRTVYSDIALQGHHIYGCKEDKPIIDVLRYDFELKTWNEVTYHRTPCYVCPHWSGRGNVYLDESDRSREFGHTIAVNGLNIYLACSENVGYIYVKDSGRFQTAKLRDDPKLQKFGSFKVNQNSGFIDRFDFSNSSFTRFEKVGDLLESNQMIWWGKIKLIDAILHNNVFFAVCLEHKHVIKVVLNQDQEQQETYSTRL